MSTSANSPMAWADDAACIGMDPDRFYVHPSTPVDDEVVATCGRCDVRAACLDWALSHERDGYWAGHSARSRARLRRSLGITLIEPDPTLPTEDTAA